jgi:hypothetical protein
MTAAPYGMGETATVTKLCQLFTNHPELHFREIVVRETGRIEIATDGGNGVVKAWCRALPAHRETEGLANTAYGWTQAVVLTENEITVTVRPPLTGGA